MQHHSALVDCWHTVADILTAVRSLHELVLGALDWAAAAEWLTAKEVCPFLDDPPQPTGLYTFDTGCRLQWTLQNQWCVSAKV